MRHPVLHGLLSMVAFAACSRSSEPDPGTGRDSGTEDARAVSCQGACGFEASYTISTDGFHASNRDRASLSPPRGYRHLAQFSGDGAPMSLTVECAPEIPACIAGGPVSACDISQDLADPDVR